MIAETMIPPEFVQVLATKTKANEVQWSVTNKSKYTIDLPECKLSLIPSDPQASAPDILVEIDTPEGAVVAVLEVKAGHAKYDEMQRLLESARLNITERLGDMLKRALDSIKETTTVTASASTTTTTPPPMPPRPSDTQVRAFFDKIAGDWFLDFSRGVEYLRIDSNGDYFTFSWGDTGQQRGEPKRKYRLTLEHCDSTIEHVELAKRELDGRVRQLEVLTISQDSMNGYAKHDAHRLCYHRR